MPRSTRHSTRQKVVKDQKVDAIPDDSTIIKTNSTPDLLVDNYNLHFELTDLEKSNTADNSNNDNEHIDRVQVGQSQVGLSSEKIVSPILPEDHDRDGSGEPDHTYPDVNPPRVSEKKRLNSTSPHHTSYPPPYLHNQEYPYHTESESFYRLLQSNTDPYKCSTITVATTKVRNAVGRFNLKNDPLIFQVPITNPIKLINHTLIILTTRLNLRYISSTSCLRSTFTTKPLLITHNNTTIRPRKLVPRTTRLTRTQSR